MPAKCSKKTKCSHSYACIPAESLPFPVTQGQRGLLWSTSESVSIRRCERHTAVRSRCQPFGDRFGRDTGVCVCVCARVLCVQRAENVRGLWTILQPELRMCHTAGCDNRLYWRLRATRLQWMGFFPLPRKAKKREQLKLLEGNTRAGLLLQSPTARSHFALYSSGALTARSLRSSHLPKKMRPVDRDQLKRPMVPAPARRWPLVPTKRSAAPTVVGLLDPAECCRTVYHDFISSSLASSRKPSGVPVLRVKLL